MNGNDVFALLAKHVVVPVIAIDSVDAALPLADALLEGGLPVAEITFRTAAAAEVIAKLAKERPSMVLGAGTILTAENLGWRAMRERSSVWPRGSTRTLSRKRPTGGCHSYPVSSPRQRSNRPSV